MPRISIPFITLILLLGCSRSDPTEPTPRVALANPASQHCIEIGGTRRNETGPDGGQVGICTLPDGRECDEWSLFRGTCGKDESEPAAHEP
jgi:putative hemolysin